MSRSSIYDHGWLNVIFEGRNQAYGAYQLRRQSGKTTLLAFAATLVLFGILAGIPTLAARLWKTPGPPVTDNLPPLASDSTRTVSVELKKVVFEEKQSSGKRLEDKTKPAVKFNKMVPSREPDATEPPTQEDLRNHTIGSENTPGSAEGNDNAMADSGEGNGTGEGDGQSQNVGNGPDEAIATGYLDRSPEFPGGLERFYTYIARNFRTPEENTGKIRVLVSFVVERDGSLTEVKVLRNPGYGTDKEAIRVLSSLKTKWTPGIYKGQKVRTLYTLPIAINPQ